MHDAALLLEVISGFDQNESTTMNKPIENYAHFIDKNIKNMKIGIIKEAFKDIDGKVDKTVNEGIKKLEENGVKIQEVSLNLPIKHGLSAYYILAASEASTNLAKYCGMRYGASDKLEGNFNQYFTKVRSHNLGLEAKRRIILGTFARMSGYRDAYYIKATKVRMKIVEEYKRMFKKFDALISPTAPILPPRFSEIEKLSPLQQYMMDVMTVAPNVAGLPHLNVPVGFSDKLPVGMLMIADHLQESRLVQLGSVFDGQ